MYRFSIKEDEWILRFSPKVSFEADERQAVLLSLLHIGEKLSKYSHGDAFLMFTKKIGAIVFDVETIPSFILTVSSIIPDEHWYFQELAN
ncbi:hypothetical protein [Neobacillus kokaensis]|uniref:Cytoplasmic protein n=1 Tax=Neobacillus kokaensis TaxID=2759023 RepID=A0ABQ3N007_9BACI|nr:hypothetical protein [Neobacillus kokaensis]GHH98258.1 hypothetical protein AM1BK_18010 [Neobacillus kokaensis]